MASKGPASKDGPSRQRRGRGFQQSTDSGKLYSDDPEGQAKPIIQPPQQDYRTAGVDYRVSEYETEGRSRPRSYNSGGAYRDSGRGGRGSGRRPRDGNAGGGVDEGAILQHTDGGVLGRGPRGRGPRGGARNGSATEDSPSGSNPPGREFGRIASVKESFGFIQCYQRGNTEIFFHVTGLDQDKNEGSEETGGGRKPDLTMLVESGQEVEFDYVPVDEKSGKPMARRVKVLAPGSLEDDVSEEILKGVVDRELRGGQRRREDAYGGRIFVSGEGNESEGEYFPFAATDLAEPSTRLQSGDQVEFRTCVSKRTGGEKKAVQVKLVSRGERRGAPKADGRSRKGGVVVVLKDTFGFVKTEPEGKVFFHFSHIEVGHTDGAKRLQEDDLVDFVLTTDPNTGKPMATSVRLLPKTESKEEVSQERRTGVVCRQPSQRRDKQVEAGLVHYRDDQGASHLATYGATEGEPSVKPDLGDEVSFGVALNPLTKAERAVDLEIVKPMAERRELGVVSLIKDHKFGFIRSSDRSEDTFFHMSEVQKDESTSGLHIGDDVEYTVVHDYRTGKENAIVVKKAAKGSAVLFDVLPERLNGVCIRRVKEAKARGMVEFTADGEKRSLEFSTNDLQDHRLTPREGEQVEFSIAESRKDKKQHATQIAMKELTGVIDGMKGTYGFIRYGPDLTERVFFHTAEVRGNVKLEKGDHVAMYVVHMEKTGEIAAKRVRRIKEAAEEPSTAPATVVGNGSEATPPPKSNIKFEGSSAVRIAKGPDGSSGFAKGRGKPLAPPAGPVTGHPINQIGSPSSPVNVNVNEDAGQEGVESLAGKRRDEGSEVDEEEEEVGEDV